MASSSSMDQKVSGGRHDSREEERQVLPAIDVMLAFEEAWKKNRKKKNKKKTKNKKGEIESHVQNDSEQHHQKLGKRAFAIQECVILSDSDDEVMKRSQRSEMITKDRMQSMEKERESNTEEGERGNNIVDAEIADHKGRNGRTSKVVADHRVSNGHTSKADEYQMLADLTSFPGLAAMLAFEATWRKTRKKKNKNKNKKRKTEVGEQSKMDQYPQKPAQIAAIEAPKLQELVILPDSNVNGGMDNGQSCKINREETTEVRVGKKMKGNKEEEEKHYNQSADNKVIIGHISKADEYKVAMLAFESTWTQNRKKNKRKYKKNKLKGLNPMIEGVPQNAEPYINIEDPTTAKFGSYQSQPVKSHCCWSTCKGWTL